MTDVTFLYKGRSKVEGKMTDGWEGRDRARGRKNKAIHKTLQKVGMKSIKIQIGHPESFGV